MEWQPMETAPKDGKPLVLWIEDTREIIPDAKWDGCCWREKGLDGFDYLAYVPLQREPSMWLRINPPSG